MSNFQRKNSESNTQVGNDFELLTAQLLSQYYPNLKKDYPVELGIELKKNHKFDLGSLEPKVIVECKAHTWTETGNVPSAKMTTWDQVLFYFYLAPPDYKKLFVVQRDYNQRKNETLCEYYIRTHSHLIPKGVEFWELNESTRTINKIFSL